MHRLLSLRNGDTVPHSPSNFFLESSALLGGNSESLDISNRVRSSIILQIEKTESWKGRPSAFGVKGIGRFELMVLGGRSYVKERNESCQTSIHLERSATYRHLLAKVAYQSLYRWCFSGGARERVGS